MSKKFITALFIITLSVFSTAQAADIKNKFINNFSEYLNSTLGQNFETVEVELSSGTSNAVVGSILVVKPLSDINDEKNTLFTQGSIFLSDDSRETINLGIGKRKLINDDTLLGYERVEYHCKKCGGHHGHIFEDGPKPTGKRYCNNGVCLTFKAKE